MAKKRVKPPRPWNPLWFDEYPKKEREKFKKWHADNPHVYELFKRMARRTMETGRTSYSAYNIFYAMRWHVDLKTKGDEMFEVNNNFIPYYIRILIHNHKEFFGFFELRPIRSKGIPSAEERRRRAEDAIEDDEDF